MKLLNIKKLSKDWRKNMAYYNKNWIADDFFHIFEQETGAKPSTEEKEYIEKLLDIKKESKGKEIYYLSIYQLKRWYPKIIVYFFILLSFKIYFKQTKAPKSLYLLSNKFAKYTLQQSIKAYCKLKD